MRSKGQSMLYAALLLPTLMLVFALAVEVGSLQMQKLRLHWAVDMATVDAATVVDAPFYTRSGRLRLDESQATTIAREYLYRNLSKLGAGVGGERAAAAIAASADIAVVNQVPTRDPYSGAPLDRPAVCARIRVPYRSSLPRLFPGFGGLLTITADAEIKS